MSFKKSLILGAALLAITTGAQAAEEKTVVSTTTQTETQVVVGGAPMYPSKTIVENASTAPELSTLVEAVKAAGLVDTLSGPGPFTVFAPTNDAFKKVPAADLQKLMADKDKLKDVLTYHVVAGNLTAADLMKKADKYGKAVLKTVEGGDLLLTSEKGKWYLKDGKGKKSEITTADVKQSNGIVHVIDGVLMP